MPEQFEQIEKSVHKEIVSATVSSYVASEIESHLAEELDFNKESEALFDFFWENNREC